MKLWLLFFTFPYLVGHAHLFQNWINKLSYYPTSFGVLRKHVNASRQAIYFSHFTSYLKDSSFKIYVHYYNAICKLILWIFFTSIKPCVTTSKKTWKEMVWNIQYQPPTMSFILSFTTENRFTFTSCGRHWYN